MNGNIIWREPQIMAHVHRSTKGSRCLLGHKIVASLLGHKLWQTALVLVNTVKATKWQQDLFSHKVVAYNYGLQMVALPHRVGHYFNLALAYIIIVISILG